MFKFLKDKLKSAIGIFSKKVDAEATVISEEKPPKAEPAQEKNVVKVKPTPKISPMPEKPVPTKKKVPASTPKPEKRVGKVISMTPKKETKNEFSKKEERTIHIPKEKNILKEIPPVPHIEPSIPQPEPAISQPIPAHPSQKQPEGSEKKKGFFGKLKEKIFKKEEHLEQETVSSQPAVVVPLEQHIEVPEQPTPEEEKPVEEGEKEGKKGLFTRVTELVTKTMLSEDKFNDLFFDLEMVLLENNVAVEVIDLIKQNLKQELVEQKFTRGKTFEVIRDTLHRSIDQLFDTPSVNLLNEIKKKKPYVIVFVGINGSGKTTSIAKIAHLLQQNKLTCVIAAADTFRAAAIQQLEEHGKNLNIKVIKHDYGSDPAAVCFDAIKYAEAKNIDAVLIDTAGRLHSNVNLMEEMKKIVRVAKPHLKLFVGEALTGNDCCDQIREFNVTVGIDGVILTKADVDEKGGAMISASYISKKPILYLGVGQEYADLKPFDKSIVLESLDI